MILRVFGPTLRVVPGLPGRRAGGCPREGSCCRSRRRGRCIARAGQLRGWYVAEDGSAHRVALTDAWAMRFEATAPVRRFYSRKVRGACAGLLRPPDGRTDGRLGGSGRLPPSQTPPGPGSGQVRGDPAGVRAGRLGVPAGRRAGPDRDGKPAVAGRVPASAPWPARADELCGVRLFPAVDVAVVQVKAARRGVACAVGVGVRC